MFRDTILIDFKRFSSGCFGTHRSEKSTWQDYKINQKSKKASNITTLEPEYKQEGFFGWLS